MSSINIKEELIKKSWKMLSENASMDMKHQFKIQEKIYQDANLMREIVHEELKDAEWQKHNDREISKIVDSLNTKSYEEVSSELGDNNIAHDLDDLMLQLVTQRKDKIPEETKIKIFQKWNEATMKPQQKKNI